MVFRKKSSEKEKISEEEKALEMPILKEDDMAETKINLFEALREKTPEEKEQELRDRIRKESLEAGVAALNILEKTRPDRFYGELFEKLDEQTKILLLLEYFTANQPIIDKLFQLSFVSLEDVLITYKKRLGEDLKIPERKTQVSHKLSDVIDGILKKIG